MKTWIIGAIAALALGACGSSKKSTCKNVMERAMECSAKMKHLPDDMKASVQDMADEMMDKVCSSDEGQAGAEMLSKCMDEDGCDAFSACLKKSSGGFVDLQ